MDDQRYEYPAFSESTIKQRKYSITQWECIWVNHWIASVPSSHSCVKTVSDHEKTLWKKKQGSDWKWKKEKKRGARIRVHELRSVMCRPARGKWDQSNVPKVSFLRPKIQLPENRRGFSLRLLNRFIFKANDKPIYTGNYQQMRVHFGDIMRRLRSRHKAQLFETRNQHLTWSFGQNFGP